MSIKPLKSLCENYKSDIVDGPFGSNMKRSDYVEDGIPVLKIQNIKPFMMEIKKMDFVTKAKYTELKRHSYKKGDIVMTKLGDPLGASAIVEDIDEGLIVADLVRIRAKKIDTKYLCYHLNSPITNGFINAQQKGATRPRVQISVVRDLPIYAPSFQEQQRIVAVLDEVFEAIVKAKANAERNLQNARELYESYLQSVFENRGDGWEEKTLGDIDLVEIIDGDRGKNYPTQKDFLDDGYCLFMNTKNVRPDGFRFDTVMFINEAKDKAMGKGKLKRNDVVMTTRGTIGNLGVYDDKVKYDNIRINSGMLIFRPNLERVTSKYLFEILRSGIIKEQIKKQVTGAAQPQLPIKTLVNFSFPVPKSIADQQTIVTKLDALSTEIKRLEANYQKKIDDLEELKKSVLQKAFAGEL